jgi:hypothetical protein
MSRLNRPYHLSSAINADCMIAPKRAICFLLPVLILSETFVSCAGGSMLGNTKGNKYSYSYKMVDPVGIAPMVFQDNNLKIQFRIDESAISFQIQNLSRSLLGIEWNRVSLGVDNVYTSTRSSAQAYADTTIRNHAVLLHPLEHIQDWVVPVKNVSIVGSQWRESDLFRTTDAGDKAIANAIAANVGKALVLILPLQIGGREKKYRFEFRVITVKKIAWKNYRLPKRLPPIPQKSPSYAPELIAAFIAVGVLGFVSFLVSLKKDPLAE